MPTLNFILDKKIYLADANYNIYCKVTGEPGSAHDSQPYVLLIPGGPGYDHQSLETTCFNIVEFFEKEAIALPHFIFFDPLSCGKSDHARNPDNEYTIEYFTEIAAQVVEGIKRELDLEKITLCALGRSFGSLVAMNLPRFRDWDDKCSIYLDKIFSLSGPIYNQAETHDERLTFIEENFPNLDQNAIKYSLNKLHSGEINSRHDYIRNVCLNLAPLYNKSYDSLIPYIPYMAACSPLLEWTAYLLSFNAFFAKMYMSFSSCNLEVMNHFFKTNYHGIRMPDVISQNLEAYQKVKIYGLVGEKDYISYFKGNIIPLLEILPNNLSGISFTGVRHQDFPPFTSLLIARLICSKPIEKILEQNSHLVAECQLAEDFHSQPNFKKQEAPNIFPNDGGVKPQEDTSHKVTTSPRLLRG